MLGIFLGLMLFYCSCCALKCSKKAEDRYLSKCDRIFFAVAGAFIFISWLIAEAVRLTLMIMFRASHAGQVCSGDFLQEVYGQDYQENEEFKANKDFY